MVLTADTDLHVRFPERAQVVARIMRASVGSGTEARYGSIFKGFAEFCATLGVGPLPAHPSTLVYWLTDICPARIKSSSCSKYLSAIRRVHIDNGFTWTQRDSTQVQQTLAGLLKSFPSETTFKIALTLKLLLKLCSVIPGWPVLDRLTYADLLWVTASAFGFNLTLRGGEFFTYPGSKRPLLLESYVTKRVDEDTSGGPRKVIMLKVPLPKTMQGQMFTYKVAVSAVLPPARAQSERGAGRGFNTGRSLLDAYDAWTAYADRRNGRWPSIHGIERAAFTMENGEPLSRAFMVNTTRELMARAKIVCTNPSGERIDVVAASWRAGHVVSALDANFDEAYIKAAGQWTSKAWTSYASLPIESLSRSVDALALQAHKALPASILTASGWASSWDPVDHRCDQPGLGSGAEGQGSVP